MSMADLIARRSARQQARGGGELPRVLGFFGGRTAPGWRVPEKARFRRSRLRLVGRLTQPLRVLTRIGPPRTVRARAQGDAGMSTAEYAIGTVAACAFAALLYKVITSTQVLDLLTGVVSRALHVPF
jgi:Protein of unknown function (DUF4244)